MTSVYRRQLREEVVNVLAQGATDQCQVLRAIGAGDPSDVCHEFRLLREATSPAAAREQENARSELASTQPGDEEALAFVEEYLGELSVPHPADYDWRFLPSTILMLARRLRQSDPLLRVALLGVPTLFPLLSRHARSVALYDLSASTMDDLRRMGLTHGLFEHDLFQTVAGEKASYWGVVADPPWYPHFLHAFVLRSAELLQVGGLLWLSVMPRLTRPTAESERDDLVRFAATTGLRLVDTMPGALGYASPMFERRVLEQQGIACGNWRRGDAFVFEKVADVPLAAFVVERPDDEPVWTERIVGAVKVKVRNRQDGPSGVVAVEPAGDAPLYSSVSRRSEDRGRIDVWSSNGVAFAVQGLAAVRYCLEVLERDPNTTAAVGAATYRGLATRESRDALECLLSALIE